MTLPLSPSSFAGPALVTMAISSSVLTRQTVSQRAAGEQLRVDAGQLLVAVGAVHEQPNQLRVP